jgi:hypothetical protein
LSGAALEKLRLFGSAARCYATGPSAAPFRDGTRPHDRTRMPRDRRDPAARKPSPYEGAGSAEVDATVARVTSDILALLADGVPRAEAAVVEALAGRHDRQDVLLTLIRLSVTGEVDDSSGKCRLVRESG